MLRRNLRLILGVDGHGRILSACKMRYRKNWESERRGCFGTIAQPENALAG